MKHIILDTNIIVSYPEVLSYKRNDTKLIIPTTVIEELYRLENPRYKDLINLTKKSEQNQNVIITDTKSPANEIKEGPRLSLGDFKILNYAQFLLDEKNDVILATNDRRLIEIAKTNNIPTFTSSELINYYSSNSTDNIEIKNDARKIENKERWGILINILIAFGILISTIFLIRNFADYIDQITNIIWILILIIAGLLLFEAREKRRQLYGFLEIGVGILTIIIIFYPKLISFNFDFYLKICGGLYIMVRGLDNLYKGSENRKLGTILRKLFRF